MLKRNNQKAWDAYAESQYDGAIAYLDDQLGILFGRLKQSGLYDSALIIVTSDHGELFGKNGFRGHRTPMYEGVLRVPLIIKFPYSKRVGREKKEIQLSDLFSTIFSICEIPMPENVSGKPFGKPSSPAVAEYENARMGQHRVLYDGIINTCSMSVKGPLNCTTWKKTLQKTIISQRNSLRLLSNLMKSLRDG